MAPRIDGIYHDQEEKEFIESFEEALENGQVKFHTEEERVEIREAWKNRVKYTKEKKPVTLRLQRRDISKFQSEAEKKGIPYQTLLASVVHQYAQGNLVERK